MPLMHHADFRRYLISCLSAMFASGMVYIGMTWVLLQQPHPSRAVIWFMLGFWLPAGLLGPWGGVIVDKYCVHRILIGSNLIRMLVLILFWLVTQRLPNPAMIYTMALVFGGVLSVFTPAATTFVQQLVTNQVLIEANIAIDIAYELGSLLGMGSAGLVIAITDAKTTLLLAACCYALSLLALMQVRPRFARPTGAPESIASAFRKGLDYLKQRPQLATLYTLQMLFFASYMTAPILLAPYAKHVLHTTAGQFGCIEASLSCGAVLGGIGSAFLVRRFGLFPLLMLQTITCGLSFFGFAHNHLLLHAMLFYFLIGFCFSAWPLLITTAQHHTEVAFQGRVLSIFQSIATLVILLFYLLLLLVSDLFAIGTLYWLEILLMLCSALLIPWVKRVLEPHHP